jgi:hypothetical protein
MMADTGYMSRSMELIELANRMCLPRLVAAIETAMVDVLSADVKMGEDVTEIALNCLEPAQV